MRLSDFDSERKETPFPMNVSEMGFFFLLGKSFVQRG